MCSDGVNIFLHHMRHVELYVIIVTSYWEIFPISFVCVHTAAQHSVTLSTVTCCLPFYLHTTAHNSRINACRLYVKALAW